ncbi:MAG TPA: hypothetical protein VE338_19910 [Ktedonobacterales bacterium]|nr:hypothetical protein [Ktedonobacterales bacterium]
MRPLGPMRRLTLGSLSVAALTLGVILSMLSGCGAPSDIAAGRPADSQARATAAAEARTATAVASTSYPMATPAPVDPAILEQPGCLPLDLWGSQPQYETVGGLRVTIPQFYTPLNYPEEMMPNNAPNAPYQVPLTSDVFNNRAPFHPNPPVNPSLDTGYVVQVCNQTSASHIITALSVNIAHFTPSNGPVTVWHLCQDGPYDAATHGTASGCGGAVGEVAMLAATLPTDATGASAQSVGNAQRSGPNLPITLPKGQSLELLITVNGLTAQGMYALTFSFSVDNAAPTTMTPSDGSFFIAPSPAIWTGTACQSSAMQAKIAATSKDTYYVCPPAA